MKNLEGLPYERDRRLKPTNFDLQLDLIATKRHTTYPTIFSEALEQFLIAHKKQINSPHKVTVRGSEDWMFSVNDAFVQLHPASFGAANTRELYRRAVEQYLESQSK